MEEIERPGEVGRSRENRTDWDDGEVGRWKKEVAAAVAVEREEKVELEEAKAEYDVDGVGERERRNCPVFLLEESAMFGSVERERV